MTEWTDDQVMVFIEIEKRLCAILGKPWRSTGMSTETLLGDIEREIGRLRTAEAELINLKEARTILLPTSRDHADKMALVGEAFLKPQS